MLFPFSSEVKSVFTFQIKEEQQKSSALMYTQTLTQWQQTGKKYVYVIYTTIAHKNRSVWLWNSSQMWNGGLNEWICVWHWQNTRHATRSGKTILDGNISHSCRLLLCDEQLFVKIMSITNDQSIYKGTNTKSHNNGDS